MELKKYNTKTKELKDYIIEKYRTKVPDGTDEIIHICDIIIPSNYNQTRPYIDKIKNAVKYFVKNGMLDKPISVIVETNESGCNNKFLLVDEYSRYLAAKDWIDIKYVPVKYIDINNYCNENSV